MDEILDPFICVPKQNEYYQEGVAFPVGKVGELAKRVHQLGLLCIKPFEKGLELYFKSMQVDLMSQGVFYPRGKNILYPIAALACVVFGFSWAVVGKGLCFSASSFKKDFVWEGPKELDQVGVSKEEFRLLSFNMGGVPDWLAARNYLQPIHDRIGLVGETLEKKCKDQMPDVMCFQEMFDEAASEKLAADLRKRGYSSIITDVGSSGLYLNSGLFLASKYPLSNVEFYSHPVKKGIEKYANKGLLIATVHVGDKRVVVGNTHLNGGAEGGGCLPRAAQLKAINAHMDRYIHDKLKEGKRIDGAFLSMDANIAPLDENQGKVVFEFEWYLQQLILDPKKAEQYLCACDLNLTQKKALESLKILEQMQLKADKVMNPAAWEEFLFHVKKLKEANLFEVKQDLEVFLNEQMPKQLGGPLPVDKWHHDIDSLEKALAGSSIDMESSHIHRKLILEPKRLDYNLTRSKKGLEDQKLFNPAQHLSTDVLFAPELSDHLPVFSHFLL